VRRLLLTIFMLAGLLSPAAQAQVAPVRTPAKRRPAKLAGRVVAFAKRQIGVPYRWGGFSHRTGFDCSGLVYAAYRSIGRKIPHSTWGQMALGVRVTFARLRPGDLVFTNGGGHVVLVVSPRVAIQAPHTGTRVSYVSLNSLRGEFDGARRLLR
jgi:cell wall-associated NlpC family hydrolase